MLYGFIFLFGLIPSIAIARWKVFFYLDSSDALSDMAIKNITDMMRGKPNDTVDFLIQMHAYGSAGLRYRVTDKGLIFLEEVPLTGDSKHDSIAAANWAFAINNADHNLLIIANHGWGILDPRWDETTKEWKVLDDAISHSCAIKRSYVENWAEEHLNHRGFLFNANRRAYLNNNDLIEVLHHITANILHKKLDIIAFDTCMGDMLEVGYQVAPYADYLVGSQSCSLVDGFDYQGVIPLLNQSLEPRKLVNGMVRAFDKYYACNDKSGIYTHAALDLSRVYEVTQAMDSIIGLLLKNSEFTQFIINACKASPRFCMWPMYTDLVAFFEQIERQIDKQDASAEIADIRAAFQDFYQKAQCLVVARCGGETTQGLAHGFAIYLPFSVIDDSYYKTVFAQETQWINLLTISCNQFKKIGVAESISLND